MDNNLNTQEQQPVIYSQQPTVFPTAEPIPNRGKGLGLSIVGMVLGISSVVLILFSLLLIMIEPDALEDLIFDLSYGRFDFFSYVYYYENMLTVALYFIFASILAVVSLILSAKGRSILNSKTSIAGIVLSSISLSVIALIVFFVTTAVMA